MEQLQQLVAGARARLVELEVNYTNEKSRVDATQAILIYEPLNSLRNILAAATSLQSF